MGRHGSMRRGQPIPKLLGKLMQIDAIVMNQISGFLIPKERSPYLSFLDTTPTHWSSWIPGSFTASKRRHHSGKLELTRYRWNRP